EGLRGEQRARREDGAVVVRRPSALAVLLLARIALAADDFSFQPPVQVPLPAGTQASKLLVQDLTGDGVPDLLVAPLSQPAVVARVGLGGLDFAPAVSTPLLAPVLDAWALGDMDGDGLPDLVPSSAYTTTTVRVLRGQGDGGFAPATHLDLGGSTQIFGVPLLDADLDGVLDVGAMQAGALHVLLGDGNGGLLPPVPNPASSTVWPSHDQFVLDLDADGLPDLAGVGTFYAGLGWVTFTNEGAGVFRALEHSSSSDSEVA